VVVLHNVLAESPKQPEANAAIVMDSARVSSNYAFASSIPISSAFAFRNVSDTADGEFIGPGIVTDIKVALLVDKKKHIMHVYLCRPGTWKDTMQFAVALGVRSGQKERDGDRKSPEGTYFIIGRKVWPDGSDVYGPLAFILDYPNRNDRENGRTGDGIWIHGTGNDSAPEQTRGCIAMADSDLMRLARIVGMGIGVPVILAEVDSKQQANALLDYETLKSEQIRIFDAYTSRKARIEKVISGWKNAWESKKIDIYESFYDTGAFYGQGMKWNSWRTGKIRTFENYSFIQLELKNVMLTEYSDTVSVIEMLQTYTSDAIEDKDIKKIILTMNGSKWKIIREESYPISE